jgi:uncharacterized delta-60 repeat protein
MSGLRKARFYAANALGLAGVAATCFLVACSDDDTNGNPSPEGGKGGKTSTAGAAGKAGAATGGASAGAPQGGDENVAGGESDGGDPGMGDAGMGGAIEPGGGAGGSMAGGAGAGGSLAGGGGAGGSVAGAAGAGGAPVVAVPNCTRDTTSGKTIAVSATGHDGLFGAAFGPDGALYATGYAQDGIAATEDRSTIVVKINATTGAIDTTWANNGVAKINVVATATGIPGQGELPRGIAFQDGKIVVAGTVEASATAAAPAGNDRNVYVLRLTAAGALDTTFGDAATPGIHTVPLNTGTLVTNATTGAITLSGADAQWGLNVLSDKKLIVTAATRAGGFQADGTTPRTDTDFAVAKLTVDGLQDTTFGLNNTGIFTLDVAQASASVRTASVLADGKLIVTGYSTYGGTQRPVIFKLTAAGALDMSFGVFGAFTEPVGTAAEAYGAVLQNIGTNAGKLVTVGYGRAMAATSATDLLSIRLTSAGLLDTSYGTLPATPGRAWFDVGGYGDNGRSLQVLNDDRPVLIGGGRLSADDQDGVITILTANGLPDATTYGPFGCKAFDFGTIGDFLWGSALSANGNTIAAVGITGNATGSTVDTDGTLVLLAKP